MASLERIFDALGGNRDAQAAKRITPLPGDFLHEPTGTLVEIDEHQHFTSHRLTALDLYPPSAPLGYDIDEYRDLCRTWAPRADRYRATKSAVGFGSGGRQRQRAYHDALRDLAAPFLGTRQWCESPSLTTMAWRRTSGWPTPFARITSKRVTVPRSASRMLVSRTPG